MLKLFFVVFPFLKFSSMETDVLYPAQKCCVDISTYIWGSYWQTWLPLPRDLTEGQIPSGLYCELILTAEWERSALVIRINEENSKAGDGIIGGSPKFWGVYKSDTFDYVYSNRVLQVISHRNTELVQSNLASKNKCWFSQYLLASQNFKVPQTGKYKLFSWWKLDRDVYLCMLEVIEWWQQCSVDSMCSAISPSRRYTVPSTTLHWDITGGTQKRNQQIEMSVENQICSHNSSWHK